MSENTTEATDITADAGDNTEVSTYKAPATQEELDNIVQKRLAKERAKYADYDELKSAAEKLRDIEESKKSELEKLTEKANALEAELKATRFDALRNSIAANYGITAEDRDLFLTGSDEEKLTSQAEALKAHYAATEARVGTHVPGLQDRTQGEATSKDAFARSLFGI